MKPDKQEILKHTNQNIYDHYHRTFSPYYLKYLQFDGQDVGPIELSHYWSKGEWLWEGYIPKSYFQFDVFVNLTREIDTYFKNKKWKTDISDYPDENWDHAGNQDYDMESFLKFVWLLNEFKTHGGFRNPVSCHYNPRAGKIVIHPGGVRSQVIGLFEGPMVYSVFFNTGEFYQPFMDDMEPWDLEEKFAEDSGWYSIGVPDHGSVIVQPGKDMHIIPGHKKDWYWRIYNRINEGRLRIKSNIGDLEDTMITGYFNQWLHRWFTNDNPTVTVNFKKLPSHFDLQRSVYSIFAEIDYNDSSIEVTQHET